MRDRLLIGEVARLTGVPAKTIRHYHHVGVLPEPPRSESGYRLYSAAHLLRLRQIRRLQALGLSLAQIRQVPAPRESPADLRLLLELILEETDAQLAALEERRRRIRELLAEETPEREPSPTFAALSEILGEQLNAVSPELLEQERRIWAALDEFDWPQDLRSAWIELAKQFAAHPEEYQQLVSFGERMAGLVGEPEGSPRVREIRAEYEAYVAAHPLPPAVEQLGSRIETPEGRAMMEIVASVLAAQARGAGR